MYTHTRIALNYSQSCINAWSRLVAGENSNITKINARSRINTGFFLWVHNNNIIFTWYFYAFSFPPSPSNMTPAQSYDRCRIVDDRAPSCNIIPCDM